MRLLDWQDASGTAHGRLRHQDEYAEWRLVRDPDGRARSIELTTELPEQWEALAGWTPELALSQIAEFAGVSEVPPAMVYGPTDPFSDATTPEQRSKAFRAQMLAANGGFEPTVLSALNNGRRALTCMAHQANTLASIVRLGVGAGRGYAVKDAETGRPRYASGSEAILGLKLDCVDRRNSDPLIAERLVRLVTDGHSVRLADPVGVYIHDVQKHELARPDGGEVPAEWFTYSRGMLLPDGATRYQRLTFQVPSDLPFTLHDLVVRRTGEHLRFGGQMAELVQLGLAITASATGRPVDITAANPPVGQTDCTAENNGWEAFVASAASPSGPAAP